MPASIGLGRCRTDPQPLITWQSSYPDACQHESPAISTEHLTDLGGTPLPSGSRICWHPRPTTSLHPRTHPRPVADPTIVHEGASAIQFSWLTLDPLCGPLIVAGMPAPVGKQIHLSLEHPLSAASSSPRLWVQCPLRQETNSVIRRQRLTSALKDPSWNIPAKQ